jgi:hypothetical protein
LGFGLFGLSQVAAAATPTTLAQAVQRDLHMSVGEYMKQGNLAAQLSAERENLSRIPGFESVWMEHGRPMIGVSGNADAFGDIAHRLQAEVVQVAARQISRQASDPMLAKLLAVPGVSSVSDPDPVSGVIMVKVHDHRSLATAQTLVASAVSERARYRVEYEQASQAMELDPRVPFSAPHAPDARMGDASSRETWHGKRSVPGGYGYHSTDGEMEYQCSAGLNAVDKSNGAHVVLTAGHCTMNGALSLRYLRLTDPDRDATGQYTPYLDGNHPVLGSFGEWQYGQLGNLGQNGVDIAVVPVASSADEVYSWPGAVLNWQSVDPDNLSTVPVTGVGDPVKGAPACHSGRNTGWQCGTINDIGYFAVGGAGSADQDIKGVMFSARVAGGDSGGPTLMGSTAIGLTTASFGGGSATLSGLLVDGLNALNRRYIVTTMDVATSPAPVPDVVAGVTWAYGPIISGTGVAGGSISVKNDKGKVIGLGTVDQKGRYTVKVAAAPQGDHVPVTLTQNITGVESVPVPEVLNMVPPKLHGMSLSADLHLTGVALPGELNTRYVMLFDPDTGAQLSNGEQPDRDGNYDIRLWGNGPRPMDVRYCYFSPLGPDGEHCSHTRYDP